MFGRIIFDKYGFWPLYHCLQEYYPIGIKFNNDQSDGYHTYPGMKKYSDALKPIQNKVDYDSVWLSFETRLSQLTGKPVVGTTMGQAPCFSAFLELTREAVGNLVRSREVHVYVSVLGPFYTVMGKDKVEIDLEEEKVVATNYVVASPKFIFREAFELAMKEVQRHFKGYRFVPFACHSSTIDAIQVPYNMEMKGCHVFNGLFNDDVDFSARIIGDPYFGFDDWIRDGYIDNGGWTSYPPGL
jgi:hypothetical protein